MWYVGKDLHDGMQYDSIQGEGHVPFKVEIGHFQSISFPFTMGSGKWPRILKLGHNTCSLSGPDFRSLSYFVSRDVEVGSK